MASSNPHYPECNFNLDSTLYITVMHSMSVVSTFINAFCAFVILKHSPPYFGWYRWNLFFYHTATWVLDWGLTVGAIPIALCPYAAGYPRGVLSYFLTSWQQSAFLVLSTMITLTACVVMFLYRAYSVMPEWHVLHVKKRNFVIMCVLIYSTVFIPYQVNRKTAGYNDTVATLEFLEKHECLAYLGKLDGFMAVDLYNRGVIGMACIFLYLLLISVSLIAACIIISFSILGCAKGISSQTRKLQKKMTVVLMSQTAVPFLCFLFPSLLAMYIMKWEIHGTQYLCDILFILASSHGIMSALSILIFNAPYFKYCRGYFISCNIFVTNVFQCGKVPRKNKIEPLTLQENSLFSSTTRRVAY